MKTIGKILILTVLLFDAAVADFPWITPPSPPLDPGGEIQRRFYLKDFKTAANMYLDIFNTSTDESVRAEALLNAADIIARFEKDETRARGLFQQLIATHPDDRYAVYGAVGILDMDYLMPSQEKNEQTNLILGYYNAPSLQQVRYQDIAASVSMIEKLHPEIAHALSELYLRYAYDLKGAGLTDEAKKVAEFGRQAFAPVAAGDYSDFLGLYLELLARSTGTDELEIGSISREPVFESVLPTEGSTVDPDVSIEIQLSAGDFRHAQLDLDSLTITLDGEDVKYDLSTRTVTNEELTEGLNLETVILSLERVLPVGAHTVSISVKTVEALDRTIGETSKTWTFNVTAGPTPPVTLDTYSDSILSLRNQHENDGANALLTLEKIQGKATRSVVAFDLANMNLDGLSRATLVLTVDSSQNIQGWGAGRTVSVQTITSPWLEGNGMNFGLQKKDQIPGNGAGATWFSPIDEDISNNSSNSAVNWNGAGITTNPPTAPAVTLSNGLFGEVAFDVTADVLNGAEHGWLILKDQENVGSKVSFYSREGAAAAGNPDLAPRLLLEFGQVASNSSGAQSETLLSRIGFGSIGTKLRPVSGSEVRSVKQLLQENQVAALAVEQLVSQATLTNPVANWTTRLAYRSWVSESIQIASNLEMVRS